MVAEFFKHLSKFLRFTSRDEHNFWQNLLIEQNGSQVLFFKLLSWRILVFKKDIFLHSSSITGINFISMATKVNYLWRGVKYRYKVLYCRHSCFPLNLFPDFEKHFAYFFELLLYFESGYLSNSLSIHSHQRTWEQQLEINRIGVKR